MGQLDVSHFQCATFGMLGAHSWIFDQFRQIVLSAVHQQHYRVALEALFWRTLTYDACKTRLVDDELRRLLEVADFTQCDRSRAIAMRFLDSASARSGFPCCFGGQLLAGGLSTRGLSCGLLSSYHLLDCSAARSKIFKTITVLWLNGVSDCSFYISAKGSKEDVSVLILQILNCWCEAWADFRNFRKENDKILYRKTWSTSDSFILKFFKHVMIYFQHFKSRKGHKKSVLITCLKLWKFRFSCDLLTFRN